MMKQHSVLQEQSAPLATATLRGVYMEGNSEPTRLISPPFWCGDCYACLFNQPHTIRDHNAAVILARNERAQELREWQWENAGWNLDEEDACE